MTKPVTRKMAVDCLLERFSEPRLVFFGDNATLISTPLRCTICGKPLLPGQQIQFDHIHADVHGGPHEYQNLRPVHAKCHKIKTKADNQANAKVKRLRGERKPRVKKRIPSRPMQSCGEKIPNRPWPKKAK